MAGTKRKTIIPKAAVARLMQNAGAQRVGIDGIAALTDFLEKMTITIGTKAVRVAKHAGRKTVQESDIQLAVQKE